MHSILQFEMKIFSRKFGKYHWVYYCYECIFCSCRCLEKGKETLSQCSQSTNTKTHIRRPEVKSLLNKDRMIVTRNGEQQPTDVNEDLLTPAQDCKESFQ